MNAKAHQPEAHARNDGPAPGSDEAAAANRMHDVIYNHNNAVGSKISIDKASTALAGTAVSDYDRAIAAGDKTGAMRALGQDLAAIDYQAGHGWGQTAAAARTKLEGELVKKGVLPEGAHLISGGNGEIKYRDKEKHEVRQGAEGNQTIVEPKAQLTGMDGTPFKETRQSTEQVTPQGTVTIQDSTYANRKDSQGRPILSDKGFTKDGQPGGGEWPPKGQELKGANGEPVHYDNVQNVRAIQTKTGTETTVTTDKGDFTYNTDSSGKVTFANPRLDQSKAGFSDATKGPGTDTAFKPDGLPVPDRNNPRIATTTGRLDDGHLHSGTKATITTESDANGNFVRRDTTYENDSWGLGAGSDHGKNMSVVGANGNPRDLDVTHINDKSENGGITRTYDYRNTDGSTGQISQKLSPDGNKIISSSEDYGKTVGKEIVLPGGAKQHIDAKGETTTFGPNGEKTTTYNLENGNQFQVGTKPYQSADMGYGSTTTDKITGTREIYKQGQEKDVPGVGKVNSAAVQYNEAGLPNAKSYTTTDGRTVTQQVDPAHPDNVLSQTEHLPKPTQVMIKDSEGRPHPTLVTDISTHFNGDNKPDSKTYTTPQGNQIVQQLDGDKVTGLDTQKPTQLVEQAQRQAIEKTIDQERAKQYGSQYGSISEQAWPQFRSFLVDKALHPERYQ